MSAAAVQAPIRVDAEIGSYWEGLTRECNRQVSSINAVVSENDLPSFHHVALKQERNRIRMACLTEPSTEVTLSLDYEQWGAKISGSVRGQETEDTLFFPEEFEFTLGHDPDLGVVAIATEGKSLCAGEFAAFVAQHFRRSFPGLSLPCTKC